MPPQVAALLLTGGASRRMGRDKATLVVDGEPLAARAARLLSAVADPVLEIGPGYTGLFTVDEGERHLGPLAAVAAGAEALGPGVPVLVLAVDMPWVTEALLRTIIDDPSPGSVVPVDEEGRLQPLCARYSATMLAAAPGLLRTGKRAIGALLDAEPYTVFGPEQWRPLVGDGISPFSDLDSPADLNRLQQ